MVDYIKMLVQVPKKKTTKYKRGSVRHNASCDM